MNPEQLSRFLSKYLRHNPEALQLTLQKGGWVNICDLIEGCKKVGHQISLKDLEIVVNSDQKSRYSLDSGKLRIRANQGHSAPFELDFEKCEPPKILFHGTAERFLSKINKEGICKMQRHHVHLSQDREMAIQVGKRHGSPIIIEIDTQKMSKDGIEFYRSENNVWLTEYVHPKYFVR